MFPKTNPCMSQKVSQLPLDTHTVGHDKVVGLTVNLIGGHASRWCGIHHVTSPTNSHQQGISDWNSVYFVIFYGWEMYRFNLHWISLGHWNHLDSLELDQSDTNNWSCSHGNCRVYFGSTPHRVTVTTRIIAFLVQNPYRPSFAIVIGRGLHPRYVHHQVIEEIPWKSSTWSTKYFGIHS